MDKRNNFWSGAMAAIGATVLGYLFIYLLTHKIMSQNILNQPIFEVWNVTSDRFRLIISLMFPLLTVQIFHWQNRNESVRGAMAVGGFLILVVLIWGMFE